MTSVQYHEKFAKIVALLTSAQDSEQKAIKAVNSALEAQYASVCEVFDRIDASFADAAVTL